jgi:CO/xanthine dehydrogenase FAD-binding subunit
LRRSRAAGDTLPWLAVMDAVVVLASAAGERRLPWHEYLVGPKRSARRPDEVILGVALSPDRPRRQSFAKVGVRQAMVIATVNCCVAVADDGAVRVALGSVGPTIIRAGEAEAFASAHPQPTPADLDEFARLVRAAIRPIDDHRSSAAYRRHAAGVIACRALERCLEPTR